MRRNNEEAGTAASGTAGEGGSKVADCGWARCGVDGEGAKDPRLPGEQDTR